MSSDQMIYLTTSFFNKLNRINKTNTHQPLELQPEQRDHSEHGPQHRAQNQRQPKDACLLRIDATLQFALTPSANTQNAHEHTHTD